MYRSFFKCGTMASCCQPVCNGSAFIASVSTCRRDVRTAVSSLLGLWPKVAANLNWLAVTHRVACRSTSGAPFAEGADEESEAVLPEAVTQAIEAFSKSADENDVGTLYTKLLSLFRSQVVLGNNGQPLNQLVDGSYSMPVPAIAWVPEGTDERRTLPDMTLVAQAANKGVRAQCS
jgi:hypothetical protein